MKKLIIIGAGGMGRTMYDMVCENAGYGKEFEVKGFIDDNLNALDRFENYPPVIGSISEYKVEEGDVFVCSIGGTFRRKCIQSILDRGGEIVPLIHPTARIGSNVKLGKGCYVGAFTTIAADAVIGDYCFIQSNTIIGHDCRVGSWNRIDSHVLTVGGVIIGEECVINTGAVLNHNVVLEDRAHVGACSFVMSNVPSDTTVFGVPARRIK